MDTGLKVLLFNFLAGYFALFIGSKNAPTVTLILRFIFGILGLLSAISLATSAKYCSHCQSKMWKKADVCPKCTRNYEHSEPSKNNRYFISAGFVALIVIINL